MGKGLTWARPGCAPQPWQWAPEVPLTSTSASPPLGAPRAAAPGCPWCAPREGQWRRGRASAAARPRGRSEGRLGREGPGHTPGEQPLQPFLRHPPQPLWESPCAARARAPPAQARPPRRTLARLGAPGATREDGTRRGGRESEGMQMGGGWGCARVPSSCFRCPEESAEEDTVHGGREVPCTAQPCSVSLRESGHTSGVRVEERTETQGPQEGDSRAVPESRRRSLSHSPRRAEGVLGAPAGKAEGGGA